MTTEVIEGNVELVEDNVSPALEATEPEVVAEEAAAPVAEAAERDFEAEAARLVEAEAAQPQVRPFTELSEDELLKDPRVNSIVQRQRQSAAQQAEAKVRKQAGSDEAVRNYVRRLRETADDPEAYERAAAEAIRLNREYSQDEVTEFFTTGVKDLYRVPADAHERAVIALERGDRAGYVTNLIDGAVAAKTAGLTLADIPEGAPLRAEIDAEIRARAVRVVAAELRAKAIEQQARVEAPPAMPVGVPSGTTGALNTTKDYDAAFNAGTINAATLRAGYERLGVPFPYE